MSKTYVPLNRIQDNPNQVRIDTGDVESLADKILQHGLRQLPEGRLLVKGEQPSSYSKWTNTYEGKWIVPQDQRRLIQLASGHRRVEALRVMWNEEVDLEELDVLITHSEAYIPISIQRFSDEEMLDLLTIENAAREDLSPVEQARLIKRHLEAGRTQAEAAEVFGCSQSWISHRTGLLELPDYVRGHIHDGELSVSQARALKPIFEADTEDVEFPEGNRFHPENIINRALEGQPSDELRRDVTQFESWMKKLQGKTQQEIREQEYEQDLESDHQSDDSQPTPDDNESDKADTVPDEPPPSENTSTSAGEVSSQHADRSSKDHADQKESPGAARPPTEPVGGDGEASQPNSKAEEIVTTVARQLSDEVDAATPTWALMALGAGRSADRQTLIEQQIWSRMSQVEANGPGDVAEAIEDWLWPMHVSGIKISQTTSSESAPHSRQH